ncbi:MAG: PrsW family intramembrane metalloprotease, partial [Polyangiaceae bacterium]|nr:PrsW family intramembrane metalloprotease [Polyangiaceae bacterium]
CAPFARIRAARRPGGRAFARAGARLAFTKWHALRAERAGRETISLDLIGPLRAELALLRATLRGRPP